MEEAGAGAIIFVSLLMIMFFVVIPIYVFTLGLRLARKALQLMELKRLETAERLEMLKLKNKEMRRQQEMLWLQDKQR